MAELVKEKQIRNGHKCHLKKLVGEVEVSKVDDLVRLKGLKASIESKQPF